MMEKTTPAWICAKGPRIPLRPAHLRYSHDNNRHVAVACIYSIYIIHCVYIYIMTLVFILHGLGFASTSIDFSASLVYRHPLLRCLTIE